MKQLIEELRNEVLSLRNMGELTKHTESILLHKINAIEKACDIPNVSLEVTANELIELYKEREATSVKHKNWSEAFQNEIRVSVLRHLKLSHMHMNRQRPNTSTNRQDFNKDQLSCPNTNCPIVRYENGESYCAKCDYTD